MTILRRIYHRRSIIGAVLIGLLFLYVADRAAYGMKVCAEKHLGQCPRGAK